MTITVLSRNQISVRLTDERWMHIIEEHGELSALQSVVLSTVAEAEQILKGGDGELLAVREVEDGWWLFIENKPKMVLLSPLS